MLTVEPIKAFTDNYIWLVSTNEGSIVIDPGESENIQKLIDNKNINLKGILITHHHYDHTNGIDNLLKKNKLEVFGPENNINGINNRVSNKDKISIIGLEFEVISKTLTITPIVNSLGIDSFSIYSSEVYQLGPL